MTLWSPDTCGCQMNCDPTTGEPTAYVVQCPVHTGAAVGDPMALNRAKNLAVAKHAAAHGVSLDQVAWSITGNLATASVGAVVSAAQGPVTLAQYKAGIAAIPATGNLTTGAV